MEIAPLPRDRVLAMYRSMLTIRLFEEKIRELFFNGMIPGFAHVSIGQEAVAVGVCSALSLRDRITSTHRGHGHLLAKGGDPKPMMAEIFGKQTGYCRGKGGSMHIADFRLGILGANGIVGAGIPIATGAALAAQLSGDGTVAVSFFGDGASNEGTFHESLNLAGLWKLPVVFVCENNRFAEFSPAAEQTSVADVAVRAAGYGLPGIVVDGNDVVAVFEAATAAVARARGGDGPTLVECKTYRWEGHVVGEEAFLGPGAYRKAEEVAAWRERCPIVALERHLLEEAVATQGELDAIRREIETRLDEAVEFAKGSPYPEPDEALADLFVTPGIGR
jgi:TPP-dependent pyruvate/acetoin dehydrogenase alpha subunit